MSMIAPITPLIFTPVMGPIAASIGIAYRNEVPPPVQGSAVMLGWHDAPSAPPRWTDGSAMTRSPVFWLLTTRSTDQPRLVFQSNPPVLVRVRTPFDSLQSNISR